ncbi:MAG: helix-turn-helix domain-containing protein, partial [Phycisphaerales bacterium JB064]
MNRALDYVLSNLSEPLPLELVAGVAGFSPFHFHRVFKSMTGETLQQFVQRVRLERALTRMTHSPDRPLIDIALECGFQSASDFSRVFRKRFGVPPSTFDIEVFRADRRERWQGIAAGDEHRHLLEGLPAGENPDGFVVR